MTSNLYTIVPPHLAVQSMRDNGYKNAAYAIAELIDNSIQAEATKVELLCAEKRERVSTRERSRVYKVAVLDNGLGMDATVLRMALQFGNGTHINEVDEKRGIGRFGMGLPAASISQCQRVDVWTWQDGCKNAIYTYLDVQQISNQEIVEVPEPQSKEIPNLWLEIGKCFGKTGTLVVWSELDRCLWKTAGSIIDNSELIIGRMYRKFLYEGKVDIRLVAFDIDTKNDGKKERQALPNDPLYLMERTSCPRPFDQEAMFENWSKDQEDHTVKVEFRGKEYEVKIRYSYAKEKARLTAGPNKNKNPGNTPYGKHAAKNIGVSIVRAGRELDLDQELVIKYDPTERWWGVEIEFSPALDDLFGVTNNKQHARNFTEITRFASDIESHIPQDMSIDQYKDKLRENEDPKGPLLQIALEIDAQIKILRRLIKAQTKGKRSEKRYEGHIYQEVEIATHITAERKQEGYKGISDEQEVQPKDQRQKDIEATLIENKVAESTAKELAAKTVDDGIKYIFTEADLKGSAFFEVDSRGGSIIILLNTNHPVYTNLVEVLEEVGNTEEEVNIETLQHRLSNSSQGLKLLLMAWARYEDELPENSKRKQDAQETREDWGRIARQFLDANQ